MISKEYRQMDYIRDRTIILLDSGKCFGFEYYILSLGTHPTAYIKIPKKHKYFQKDYNNIKDIDVHGGLTFSDNKLIICPLNTKEDWFIGWDYAHFDDYSVYDEKVGFINGGPHKWTTEEIQKEVYDACLQLKSRGEFLDDK